jgi:hypothetical protein
MPKRMRIDVSHDKRQDAWVTKGGGERYTFATKKEAVDGAVAAARQAGNAQVVNKYKVGKIQCERTYGNPARRTKG